MDAIKTLPEQLKTTQLIMAPGAYDGLSARLVEKAGFSAVYASGGAIARSTGVPDIGLLSLTEVADRLAQMTAVIHIPLIADADTGFGNVNNVERTVHIFESAGVAALHLVDDAVERISSADPYLSADSSKISGSKHIKIRFSCCLKSFVSARIKSTNSFGCGCEIPYSSFSDLISKSKTLSFISTSLKKSLSKGL
jgi:hypothetical protein